MTVIVEAERSRRQKENMRMTRNMRMSRSMRMTSNMSMRMTMTKTKKPKTGGQKCCK